MRKLIAIGNYMVNRGENLVFLEPSLINRHIARITVSVIKHPVFRQMVYALLDKIRIQLNKTAVACLYLTCK